MPIANITFMPVGVARALRNRPLTDVPSRADMNDSKPRGYLYSHRVCLRYRRIRDSIHIGCSIGTFKCPAETRVMRANTVTAGTLVHGFGTGRKCAPAPSAPES